MSLRDGAIEAMAEAVEGDCDIVECTTPAQHVFAALDALLDYLGTHRDEWPMEAKSDDWGAAHLLAVLGVDTE